VLVMLPPLASALAPGSPVSGRELAIAVGRTLLEVATFVALMLIVGRRVFPWILWQVTRTGSRELFTLCVVAAAVSIAYGAARLFGVSFALGAFFAGMVLRESQFSQRCAGDPPLRDAFAVLFSYGRHAVRAGRCTERPLKVLVVVTIIIANPLVAATLVLLHDIPQHCAHGVGKPCPDRRILVHSAGVGMSLGLLPRRAGLILAGALVSIALNP
jgi:CPA2 family monovalent cation:H+ antiporter-2